jgi:hypothetical protein
MTEEYSEKDVLFSKDTFFFEVNNYKHRLT